MKITRHAAAALAVAAGATALVATTTSPSMAATPGRTSNHATFNYHSQAYLNSGGAASGLEGYGSDIGFATTQKDLAGFTFLSYGAGQGQAVKNNAAHIFNDTTKRLNALVYLNSYTYNGCWCGTFYVAPPDSSKDLPSALKNNNAAFAWSTTTDKTGIVTS